MFTIGNFQLMKKNNFLIVFIILFPFKVFSESMAFFGPMIMWDLDYKNTSDISWGFEISYWKGISNASNFPVSVDIGIEFHDGKRIFYSEIQTGMFVLGESLGVVYDPQKGLGIQASAWGVYGLGGIYRVRYFDEFEYFRGVFYKAMIDEN